MNKIQVETYTPKQKGEPDGGIAIPDHDDIQKPGDKEVLTRKMLGDLGVRFVFVFLFRFWFRYRNCSESSSGTGHQDF